MVSFRKLTSRRRRKLICVGLIGALLILLLCIPFVLIPSKKIAPHSEESLNKAIDEFTRKGAPKPPIKQSTIESDRNVRYNSAVKKYLTQSSTVNNQSQSPLHRSQRRAPYRLNRSSNRYRHNRPQKFEPPKNELSPLIDKSDISKPIDKDYISKRRRRNRNDFLSMRGSPLNRNRLGGGGRLGRKRTFPNASLYNYGDGFNISHIIDIDLWTDIQNMDTFDNSLIDSKEALDALLFCPLQSSNDAINFGLMRERFGKVSSLIYNNQFSHNCDISQRKFYIVEHSSHCGIFCQMHMYWAVPLATAISDDRTLLFSGKWLLAGESPMCAPDFTRECMFAPVSNCQYNVNDIINESKAMDSYYFIDETMDIDCPSMEELSNKRVIVVKGKRCNSVHSAKWQTISHQTFGIDFFNWRAYMYSFFLRLQPSVDEITEQIVEYSLLKSISDSTANDFHWNGDWDTLDWKEFYKYFKPQNTISMPIRWGDKCKQETRVIGVPEMDCLDVSAHMAIAEDLRTLLPNLNTIIVTSESNTIIDDLLENYVNQPNSTWNFIINHGDMMQGTGNPVMIERKSDIKFDFYGMMVSIVSSIKLQMYGSIFTVVPKSNWENGIWILAYRMQCNIDDLSTYLPELPSLHSLFETKTINDPPQPKPNIPQPHIRYLDLKENLHSENNGFNLMQRMCIQKPDNKAKAIQWDAQFHRLHNWEQFSQTSDRFVENMDERTLLDARDRERNTTVLMYSGESFAVCERIGLKIKSFK